MDTVRAGKPLIDFIKVCADAGESLMLIGSKGIGKSEIFRGFGFFSGYLRGCGLRREYSVDQSVGRLDRVSGGGSGVKRR